MRKAFIISGLALVAGFLMCAPGLTRAQEVHQDLQETVEAVVLSIEEEYERDIIGTDATAMVQELLIRIGGGLRDGEEVMLTNDLVPLKEGDHIFVNRIVNIEGVEYFQFKDADRRGGLITLGILGALLLVLFSGMHGVRALLALALSIAAILFLLVPALLSGYSPVLASIGIAGLVLACVLFATHGFKASSVIAFLGTFGAVLITSLIAMLWTNMTRLTGFDSDAAVYLNFSTKGTLDFSALLLGSIIIGILGILDDVAVTQASVVAELKRANNAFGKHELYRRALRVGRDHIASLVNTLAFAYVGAALPLILLLARTDSPISMLINQEIVATEIVRIIVGSIGLVLAVPLTTFIAAWWYDSHEPTHEDEGGHHHHAHT